VNTHLREGILIVHHDRLVVEVLAQGGHGGCVVFGES
jgi:hypothetical protein